MSNDSSDRANAAFRRLLADAKGGGQTKVDALVALSQRTVFVSPWTPDGDGFRVLTNSNGQSALPIFTEQSYLDAAAGELGWQAADGTVAVREVGSREALRHAIAHNLDFVVVDITSVHSIEISRGEIEPLLSPQARRESRGPFAGVGRVSSSMMQAVQASPVTGDQIAPPSDAVPARSPSENPAGPGAPAPPPGVSVGPAAAAPKGPAKIEPLNQEPSEPLLVSLAELLRQYPEVEWAALANVNRGHRGSVPTVGLKVDASYRARVSEIITEVQRVSADEGAALEVLLLDDPEVIRMARSHALMFYPWRR